MGMENYKQSDDWLTIELIYYHRTVNIYIN